MWSTKHTFIESNEITKPKSTKFKQNVVTKGLKNLREMAGFRNSGEKV